MLGTFKLSNTELVRSFWQGYEDEPAFWQTIAPQVGGISFGSENTKTFRWLELLTAFQDWTGLAEIPLATADGREYQVTRKKWGRNVLVDEEEGDNDQGGMIYAQARGVGSAWPAAQNTECASFLEGLHQDKLLWDDQYFFDGAHPGKTAAGAATTFANKFQLALSADNLETVMAAGQTFRYPNGELCNTNFTHLVVPPAKRYTAEKLVYSEGYPESANQGRNPMFRKLEVVTFKNLTDTNRWYLLDLSHAIKPILWVPKKELQIVLPLANGSNQTYLRSRKLEYSADASGAFACSFWWWATMADPDISV
jgi:phage major head subunit gpT-like protein